MTSRYYVIYSVCNLSDSIICNSHKNVSLNLCAAWYSWLCRNQSVSDPPEHKHHHRRDFVLMRRSRTFGSCDAGRCPAAPPEASQCSGLFPDVAKRSSVGSQQQLSRRIPHPGPRYHWARPARTDCICGRHPQRSNAGPAAELRRGHARQRWRYAAPSRLFPLHRQRKSNILRPIEPQRRLPASAKRPPGEEWNPGVVSHVGRQPPQLDCDNSIQQFVWNGVWVDGYDERGRERRNFYIGDSRHLRLDGVKSIDRGVPESNRGEHRVVFDARKSY